MVLRSQTNRSPSRCLLLNMPVPAGVMLFTFAVGHMTWVARPIAARRAVNPLHWSVAAHEDHRRAAARDQGPISIGTPKTNRE
jgi:hypothetical protein